MTLLKPAKAPLPEGAATIPPGKAKTKGKAERDAQLGRRTMWGPAFALPHGLGLAIFTLLPIVVSLIISLFRWPLLGTPSFLGLGNYQRLFSDPIFGQVVVNTVLFVVLYVPLNLVVSLGLAAWLTPRIKGRHIFRVIFFIPSITPVVANVVVWRMLYQPGGFIDGTLQSTTGISAPNFLGDEHWAMMAIVVMSVWQGFGYNMLVFSAALDAVPENLTEAAAIDGANAWTIFWRIKLKLISPSIFFGTMMTLITSFQVFAQPFILTKGGPGSSTSTIVLYIYNQGFQFHQLGLASAAAWILFVIILGVTAVQFLGQKKWVHYDA
ncbi:sugar ABC transporter permease [Arthrobacter sp. efr-133-TYG-118]|uniref:carbohydrate ABC transporter permease n=1 Tax=Arthrobacter sp. efr-133-TYG-118 TaxID=3040279 RepID=UPI00254E8EBF|nr:sugar ABC transporter permease [Arthrobacter sp. efr-133-TYG-118]